MFIGSGLAQHAHAPVLYSHQSAQRTTLGPKSEQIKEFQSGATWATQTSIQKIVECGIFTTLASGHSTMWNE
jgi:hypothetical protein